MLSLFTSHKKAKRSAAFILAERAPVCARHRPHRSSNKLGTLVTTDLGCDARGLRLSSFERPPLALSYSFVHSNLRLRQTVVENRVWRLSNRSASEGTHFEALVQYCIAGRFRRIFRFDLSVLPVGFPAL